MKRVGYFLWQCVWFPVDLFRFTTDCWKYTFGWVYHCWVRKSRDQPCIFCQGLDVGHVPRRVSFRIKYRNLWLVKLLQDDLSFKQCDDRIRPRIACMREGGYIQLKPHVPILAVTLGLAWNAALVWVLWAAGIIPEEAKSQVMGFLGGGA